MSRFLNVLSGTAITEEKSNQEIESLRKQVTVLAEKVETLEKDLENTALDGVSMTELAKLFVSAEREPEFYAKLQKLLEELRKKTS